MNTQSAETGEISFSGSTAREYAAASASSASMEALAFSTFSMAVARAAVRSFTVCSRLAFHSESRSSLRRISCAMAEKLLANRPSSSGRFSILSRIAAPPP